MFFNDPVVQRIQGYALRTRRSQFNSVRGLQVCSRSSVDLERRPAEVEVASSSLAGSAKVCPRSSVTEHPVPTGKAAGEIPAADTSYTPLAQRQSGRLTSGRSGFQNSHGVPHFLRSRLAAKTLARLARYPEFESLLLNQIRSRR